MGNVKTISANEYYTNALVKINKENKKLAELHALEKAKQADLPPNHARRQIFFIRFKKYAVKVCCPFCNWENIYMRYVDDVPIEIKCVRGLNKHRRKAHPHLKAWSPRVYRIIRAFLGYSPEQATKLAHILGMDLDNTGDIDI